MEAWRTVFRKGVVPHLSTAGLEALERGLADDDSRILQGATTEPPPLQYVADWPAEKACVIGYAGWLGEGLETVREVEEFFGRVCFLADETLGEWGAVRWFINTADETPREEFFPLLLAEVRLALEQRRQAAQPERAAS